jgi:hypothetical protein
MFGNIIIIICLLFFSFYNFSIQKESFEKFPITRDVERCVINNQIIHDNYDINDLISKFEKYLIITESIIVAQDIFLTDFMNYISDVNRLKYFDKMNVTEKIDFIDYYMMNQDNIELLTRFTIQMQLLHNHSYNIIKNRQDIGTIKKIYNSIVEYFNLPFKVNYDFDLTTSYIYRNIDVQNETYIGYYATFFHPEFNFTDDCQIKELDGYHYNWIQRLQELKF